MIELFQGLIIPVFTLVSGVFVLGLIQSNRRLQIFYLLSQATLSMLMELEIVLVGLRMTDIMVHLILSGSIILVHIVTIILTRLFADQSNPYGTLISISGREYLLDLGMFDLGMITHPSLEGIDEVILDNTGELLETDYADYMKSLLLQFMTDYFDITDLQFQIIQLPAKTRLYRKYVFVAYTISPVDQLFERTTNPVGVLQIEEPRFQRVKLGQLNYRKIQRAIGYDVDGKLLINPAKLLDSSELTYFELGIHELDIFAEIVKKSQQEGIEIDDFTQFSYPIGYDLNGYPIHLPEVDNIIYLGTAYDDVLLQLPFINSLVIISDDPDQMVRIQQHMQSRDESVKIISYDKLSFDLIRYGSRYPNFLRLILRLWEYILPADSKSTRQDVSSKISEFVELQQILNINHADLTAADLVDSRTYRRFNIDLSDKVFSKLKPVLSQQIFNSARYQLENLFTSPYHSIIDLSRSTKLETISLFLLLAAIQDLRIQPGTWVYCQLHRSDLQLDTILAKLAKFISCTDIIMQLQIITEQPSWLHQFELLLADHTMTDEKLREYLFFSVSSEPRLDINLGFDLKTALTR